LKVSLETPANSIFLDAARSAPATNRSVLDCAAAIGPPLAELPDGEKFCGGCVLALRVATGSLGCSRPPENDGENAMKRVHVVVLLVIAGVAASAAAETKKPVTQWTCEDFIAIDDQYKPNVIYWATAYAKGGKPEASELDIAATEQVTPMIIDDCEKEPKASFWQKLKGAWDKVEDKVESEVKKMEQKM
jgi:acid stress chaperone HdeA